MAGGFWYWVSYFILSELNALGDARPDFWSEILVEKRERSASTITALTCYLLRMEGRSLAR